MNISVFFSILIKNYNIVPFLILSILFCACKTIILRRITLNQTAKPMEKGKKHGLLEFRACG